MLAADNAYLTSAAAAEEMDLDMLNARAKGFDVTISNITRERAIIGVMGPKSRELLSRITSADLGARFPWLSAKVIDVAGVPVLALRVSYVGELGWELHVAREDAVALLEALEGAGKPLGLGYYGAYAANSMRIEKSYRSWGSDLTTERTPLETGVAALVKTDGRSFVGRDAMLAKPKPWDMVLLEIETTDVDPFYSHTVYAEGRPVGIVTSGAHGHRTGKTLALAFLREPDVRDGLSVKILGRTRSARVLDTPPYDPANNRLKA
jgi:dimethylglycine dehydrogenase